MTNIATRPSPATDRPPRLGDQPLHGFSLAAGGANVIMQLAKLPVGHGVARSTVDSGRVDKHPLKRLRTTTAFLLIALYGTPEEQQALRKQIDRVHAQVRSQPGDPVAYNAFDTDLQLWVAACLYMGVEDLYTRLYGALDPAFVDEDLYPRAQSLGTMLQVTPEQWPADRAAFETYWQEGVASIEMDDLTRTYLQGIAELRFVAAPIGPLGRPLRALLAPLGRLMNLGFLPQPFRDELGLPFSAFEQRLFDTVIGAVVAVSKRLPAPLRGFPLNVYLRDTRKRLAEGIPVI